MSRSAERAASLLGVLGLFVATTGGAGVVACHGKSTPAASASPTSGSASAPLAAGPAPREITTPSTLELSGITWAPQLDRWLVVSDDVDEGADRHLPEVFALSKDGALDAQPIPIEGVSALNDLESICAGPNGTFFATTSHSPNKKGHIPPTRRALLHLALEGRKLVILGRADLTTARSGFIDAEALAFRDGTLYVGLKAPLDDKGQATILAIADAAAAVKAGSFPPGSVSVWATPRLCPGAACEGVSDMAFLPGGQLLLVANSPKGAPSDGGGSLYRLASPTSSPELLRRFPGFKPEGVALAPDGASIVLVFDRDKKQPMWLSLPVPP